MVELSLPEETIFARAREMESGAERAAFLERACGGDVALRAEVEALLRADERSGDLLDLPDRLGRGLGLPGVEQPGAFIGAYVLRRELGEGGMGTVWLAEQCQPVRRLVALKIVKPGMSSRRVIARFEAERQMLAAMDHPNIAKVYDAGTTECGRPYFVMELVDGRPITEYCDQCRLTLDQRLELFLHVCHAVQHAHQKGIIHRDLKSSNVLVGEYDGVVAPKVIDFGVSKATGELTAAATTLTHEGQFVGTLESMSPEQARFNPADIDTRSDVYSLGVLLYELLTGTTPFGRSRLRAAPFDEVLHIIRQEEPPRPSVRLAELARDDAPGLAAIAACRRTTPVALRRRARGDLDWIALKALEKERCRRYQTANALATDVQCHLADEPIVACPPSVRYRVRKFVRRNKAPVVGALLLIAALIAGIVGTTWGMIRARHESSQKEAALASARSSARLATDQLFEALLNQARATRVSRRIGQRLDSLDALARAARIRPDVRLRDEAIAAMALPDLAPVPGTNEPWRRDVLAYGANYTRYARALAGGKLSIRTIPDNRELREIASPRTHELLHFSPDDQFLIGLGWTSSPLHVWRLADAQLIVSDERITHRVHAFSPDGRRLAVGELETARCFDLSTGQEVARWSLPARSQWLAFHPDSTTLAVGYQLGHDTGVYDATRGVLLAELPVGAMSGQIVAWHPDGERLAVAGTDPSIQIWNVPTKRKVASLKGHVKKVARLTFHPDGDLLASQGWDGWVLLWHPSSPEALMRLTSPSYPRFSADGQRLGVTRPGDVPRVLAVATNPEYRTLAHSGGLEPADFALGSISPDGRLLALGTNVGARVWDLTTGRESAILPEGTNFVFFEANSAGADEGGLDAGARWRLLTSGEASLLRWEITSHDPAGLRLQVGTPTRLAPERRAWFARTPDGRTLTAVTAEGGPNRILELPAGAVRRVLPAHPKGEVHAISRDGRWAASSGWHSDRVRLWELATSRMVREWVLGTQTCVFFTPDSRALIIARGDGFTLWDLERLRPIYGLSRPVAHFPGWVAFSPDDRLMALELAPGVIHLAEVATGRTVAELADPHGDRATWHEFTPDGTRLVVASGYAGAIHIWDLRAIRTRLKAMNLDWDWPEFPPADAEGAPVGSDVAAVRPRAGPPPAPGP